MGVYATLMTVAALVLPSLGDEVKGKIKSIDRKKQQIVVEKDATHEDVTVNLGSLNSTGLGKGQQGLGDVKVGDHISVESAIAASRITPIATAEPKEKPSLLAQFWDNFRHNLFKPLLLFFYLGFPSSILPRYKFEFPYVVYQALTIYLLIAIIGWHGGEEVGPELKSRTCTPGCPRASWASASSRTSSSASLAYLAELPTAFTRLRRVQQATVARLLRVRLRPDRSSPALAS